MGRYGTELPPILLALGFQAFLIIVCVAIYAVLVQNIALEDDIIMQSGAAWATPYCCALRCSKPQSRKISLSGALKEGSV